MGLTHLQHVHRQVEHLRRIASALANAVSMETMVQVVAEECREALGADAICVYLIRGEFFEMVAEINCSSQFKRELKRLPVSVIPMRSFENPHEALFFGSASEFKTHLPFAADLVDQAGRHTISYGPLVVNQTPMGILGFSFNQQPEAPTGSSFVLTLINLCAQALDRARLFQQEKNARKLAEAANRAKTDFLANMSHEMGTPISVIQGFSELLLESDGIGPKPREWASIIHRNTLRLTEIVSELLDISKVEAGEVDIEGTIFCVNDLLNDVRNSLSLRHEDKRVSLMFTELKGSTFVYSDPRRLRQILINLVGNALKFTSHGEVQVRAQIVGECLEIFVQDTGIGMPREYQARLFEPFTQAETSMNRRFSGTGLGLSISKRLALILNGDLTLLESIPNKGSIFLLRIKCESGSEQWAKRRLRQVHAKSNSDSDSGSDTSPVS